MLPWFFSADHLPSGNTDAARNRLLGDGAFSLWDHSQSGLVQVFSGTRNSVGMATTGTFTTARISKFIGLGGTYLEASVGFRISRSAGGANMDAEYVKFENPSGGTIMRLWNNGTNVLVQRGSGAATLATLAQFPSNAYIEFYVFVDGAAGRWEVRVDGVTAGSGTGVSTEGSTGGIYIVTWSNARNTTLALSDIYIREATDLDRFYGPIFMRILRPESDVTANWTRSSGADNYALVNETTSDLDTTYIETNVSGTHDQYGIPDLPSGANSIIAVCIGTVARAPSGGAPLVSHTAEVGGVLSEPAGKALASSYRTQLTTHMLAPDGSAWSKPKIDSLIIGPKAA